MIFSKPLRVLRGAFQATAWSLLVALLAGCASMGSSTPEETVRQRAQARWDALLAGKFDQAYQFLSPASRAVLSPERYRGSFGGAAAWKAVRVESVSCTQPDRCIASIKVTYEPNLRRGRLGTIDTSVEETWLLDAGQWWLPQGL
jgi:hypothetical protein